MEDNFVNPDAVHPSLEGIWLTTAEAAEYDKSFLTIDVTTMLYSLLFWFVLFRTCGMLGYSHPDMIKKVTMVGWFTEAVHALYCTVAGGYFVFFSGEPRRTYDKVFAYSEMHTILTTITFGYGLVEFFTVTRLRGWNSSPILARRAGRAAGAMTLYFLDKLLEVRILASNIHALVVESGGLVKWRLRTLMFVMPLSLVCFIGHVLVVIREVTWLFDLHLWTYTDLPRKKHKMSLMYCAGFLLATFLASWASSSDFQNLTMSTSSFLKELDPDDDNKQPAAAAAKPASGSSKKKKAK